LYTILEKQVLSDTVKLMVVKAPHVARKARPGQFVIVRIDEPGERIPLTIADFDRQAETITLIFQEVGKSTMQMGTLETVGLSYKLADEYVGKIKAITAEQVQDVARKYLVDDHLTVAQLEPQSMDKRPKRKPYVLPPYSHQ